jgi:hypothetical protein
MKKAIFHMINKEYVVKIFIEMFSVIFAVILALFINESQNDKYNKHLAETAFNNIKTECESNKTKLESMLKSHDSILYVFDSVITQLENTGKVTIVLSEFTLEQLSDAAWEATKYTNAINYMDFKLIMDISSIYDLQKMYQKLVDDFYDDRLLTSRDDTVEDKISQIYKFHSYLGRFTDFGHQIIDEYASLIEKLNSR